MDIITREQAKSQGLSHYFTGEVCKNGHIDRRNTKSGRCMECIRAHGARFREERPEVMQKWRAENPGYASQKYHENREDRLKQTAQWYQDNREHVLQRRSEWYYTDDVQEHLKEWRKQWYAANPNYDKEYYAANRSRYSEVYIPKQKVKYNAKKRKAVQEAFQQLAQDFTLPESPSEHDFKYWFAGEIIRRTGWVVNKEVFLDEERTSRIDLLIPEAKIGIELKLSNHRHPATRTEAQRARYQQLLEDQGYTVIVVSLDGSLGISAAEYLMQLSL